MERINLRHSSFVPAEDLSWNKEVTREASISAVSPRLGPGNNIPLFENWDGFSRCWHPVCPASRLSLFELKPFPYLCWLYATACFFLRRLEVRGRGVCFPTSSWSG